MIEHLWWSLKYECVYLHAFEAGSEMRVGISKWLTYYNAERPHSSHGILTHDEALFKKYGLGEIRSITDPPPTEVEGIRGLEHLRRTVGPFPTEIGGFKPDLWKIKP